MGYENSIHGTAKSERYFRKYLKSIDACVNSSLGIGFNMRVNQKGQIKRYWDIGRHWERDCQ